MDDDAEREADIESLMRSLDLSREEAARVVDQVYADCDAVPHG